MRNGGISRLIASLLVAGCADVTFDLLPPPGNPAPDGEAGEGGVGGNPPASGGSAGLGGMGAAGTAGGCNAADGCILCRDQTDCAGTDKPFCLGVCVACRPCSQIGCHDDCGKGERCDPGTYECTPECIGTSPCVSERFPFCDDQRNLCTECDASRMDARFGCPGDLKCSIFGTCEKCGLSTVDCPEDKPICGAGAGYWECRGCLSPQECSVYSPTHICDINGRCVSAPQQP